MMTMTTPEIKVSNSHEENESSKVSRLTIGKLASLEFAVELCHGALAALGSPLMLQLGIPYSCMTLIWSLGPATALLIAPHLGKLSDQSSCRFGKRRIFVLFCSLAVIAGLLLVPYASAIVSTFTGESLWDVRDELTLGVGYGSTRMGTIILTVIGTWLIDTCGDLNFIFATCRMMEALPKEQQTSGITFLTVGSSIGGSIGYSLSAFNWESLSFGTLYYGGVRPVFTIVLIIYIISVLINLSVPEGEEDANADGVDKLLPGYEEKILPIPPRLKAFMGIVRCFRMLFAMTPKMRKLCIADFISWFALLPYVYYLTDFVGDVVFHGNPTSSLASQGSEWSSTTLSPFAPLVTTPLSSTDNTTAFFFNLTTVAPSLSVDAIALHNEGVRFGSLALFIHGVVAALYSASYERVVETLGGKGSYVFSHLCFTVGVICLAGIPSTITVIFSAVMAGVHYGTIDNLPYMLIERYHDSAKQTQEVAGNSLRKKGGLATHVSSLAIVQYMAQLAQGLLIGWIVELSGTTLSIMYHAAIFSIIAAFQAYFVDYADL